jgi:hypothetical protein
MVRQRSGLPAPGDGATAIRIKTTTVLRAALLSLAAPLALLGAASPALAQASNPAARDVAETAAPVEEADAAPLDEEIDPALGVSDAVIDIAAWALATQDNLGLPFAIVDKAAAQIIVFGADGKVRGLAPALVGSAVGDHSAPGVGDRELRNIPAKDRTTPAGRYVAAFGPAAGNETVLWIDYDTAVSIHPTPDTDISRKEKRAERLASPETDDNRITHGCINVSPRFFDKVVQTSFKGGGVFYILPDKISLKVAFPKFNLPAPQRVAIQED